MKSAVIAILFVVASAACDTITIGRDSTSDAAPPDTSAGATCGADSDCDLFVDFCLALCGKCVAAKAPAPASACSPPAGVRCDNACRDTRALCRQGLCQLVMTTL